MVALVIGVGISLLDRVLHAVVVIGAIVVIKFLMVRRRKTREERARAAGLPPGMIRESPYFRLVRGLAVTDLGGVHEGYMARPGEGDLTQLTANVSAERLAEVILALAAEVREPSVLILDVPAREAAPREPGRAPSLCRDVFEMDHMTHARFASFFRRHAEVLVHDGHTWLWYGTGDGREYVLVGMMKVVRVGTDDPHKFMRVLDGLGYEEEPELHTAADNLSKENPAFAQMIDVRGRTVYDVVEALKRDGLYLLERREA